MVVLLRCVIITENYFLISKYRFKIINKSLIDLYKLDLYISNENGILLVILLKI